MQEPFPPQDELQDEVATLLQSLAQEPVMIEISQQKLVWRKQNMILYLFFLIRNLLTFGKLSISDRRGDGDSRKDESNESGNLHFG